VSEVEVAVLAEFLHDDFALLDATADNEDLFLTSPASSSSDICMVEDVQHEHFSNTIQSTLCLYYF